MKLSCGFGTAQYYQLYLGYLGTDPLRMKKKYMRN